MASHLDPETVPVDARQLAERLASRLKVVTGRLELIYVDGRYVDGYKHQRVQPSALAGIPAEEPEHVEGYRIRLDPS